MEQFITATFIGGIQPWSPQATEDGLKQEGVRKMKPDKSLITGIVLGIVAGLFFTAQLVPFTQLLVIVSVVLIMRYMRVI